MELNSVDDFDHIQITDQTGACVAQLGLMFTLYFRYPIDAAVRTRAARIADDYIARVPGQLRWALLEEGHVVTAESLGATITELVAGTDLRDEFVLSLTSAHKVSEAGAFHFEIFLDGTRVIYDDDPLGYITGSFPVGFLAQLPPGTFQRIIAEYCVRLSPWHGYAGFGFIRSIDVGDAMICEPLLVPLVRRFPGVEIDEPVFHRPYLHESIKGVNWLTIVADELLDRIGGREPLRRLGADFPLVDYPGGVIVQAGPHPQMGDTERNDIPLHYRRVYQVLRPLQTDYPDAIMKTPPGIDALKFTQRWLQRFA